MFALHSVEAWKVFPRHRETLIERIPNWLT
jgi:hypothetical protein